MIRSSVSFLLLALFASTFCLGCSSGGKSPDDSFLASLNGAAYNNQSSIALIPIGGRKLTRLVQGQVQCNPGLEQYPINHAQVDLLCDGKVVDTGFTDYGGEFSIAHEIKSGSEYRIRVTTRAGLYNFKLDTGPRGLASNQNKKMFIDCGSK
jgi:hypothetical protein